MLILRNNYYSSPEEEEYLDEMLFSSSVIDEDEYLQRMYGISQYVRPIVRKLKDKIIAGKNYLLGHTPQMKKVDAYGEHLTRSVPWMKKSGTGATAISTPALPTKDAPFARGREKLEEITAKMRENQANYRKRFEDQVKSWGII